MIKVNHLFLSMAFAMLVCGGNIVAQTPKKKQDLSPEKRIELRTEQMQQRLMLDEKAADQFAPLYKEYLQALKACKPEAKKEKPVTDADIKEALTSRLKMQRAVIDTKEKYLEKFSAFLTARQLEVLFKAPDKPMMRRHQPPMMMQKGKCKHCPVKAGNPA